MKTEFSLAFNEVLDKKQLPHEVVMEALEAAMISAYRKAVNASNAQQVIAKIDPESGGVRIFAEKEVAETVQDDRTEVSLKEAKKVDPEAEIGGIVMVDTTPKNFGRVAAQTARQVIQQRIREAEREEQYKHFSTLVGEIVNGIVQATNSNFITLGLEKQAEGRMPRSQQIPGERFHVHDRVRALLLDVKNSPRDPDITLSRAHRDFLRRLLEDEVPEIYHGLVEVRSIAREPGQRSKVAVSALQQGIDPVGACVGVRGVRIQAIVRELNDEKIDVIEWNPEPTEFIAKALSPARVVGVYLDKHAKGAKTATVVVPEDQLSLAIGRDGQNARLAAKLTGWRIDIKSLPEAASDAIYKLQKEPDYAELVEREAEAVQEVEAILTKKSEGRPVTPEEYQVLNQFVERVEGRIIEQREEKIQAEKEEKEAIQSAIPKIAYDTPIDEIGISPRFCILLSGEGYPSVGDLLYQMELNPDSILALNGIGPKAMKEIEEGLKRFEETHADEFVEVLAEEEETTEEVLAEEVPAEAEAMAPAPEAVLETTTTDETTDKKEEETEEETVAEVIVEEEVEVEEEEAEEEEDAFEEMFSPEQLGVPTNYEYEEYDEEEEKPSTSKKRKKKRKKRYSEVIYDPERDITVVKRKRKRGEEEWTEEWDEDWE